MEKVVIDHLTGHKALESNFINCQVLPMVRAGKNHGFIYQVNLKEGEEFLFQNATKPQVEILAVDKYGRKRDKFSTTMIFNRGNEVARLVHYWLERLIREDKNSYRERFYNTYTSENDERFKELYGSRKKRPYFSLFIRIFFIILAVFSCGVVIYLLGK